MNLVGVYSIQCTVLLDMVFHQTLVSNYVPQGGAYKKHPVFFLRTIQLVRSQDVSYSKIGDAPMNSVSQALAPTVNVWESTTEVMVA